MYMHFTFHMYISLPMVGVYRGVGTEGLGGGVEVSLKIHISCKGILQETKEGSE